MFWSGETLLERLPDLNNDFMQNAVDCNAWTLTIGDQIYITPTAKAAESGTHTIRNLSKGECFQIPPGQFAFLQTKECVNVPNNAMAFISIKASIKFRGLVNVSGFHVDPGFKGVLVFAVYNAGPTPIHLQQGQQCFLIWFASLDTDSSQHVKSSPSNRKVDGDTISRISGKLQSLDDFSDRMNNLEQTAKLHTIIGSIVLTVLVPTFIALLKYYIDALPKSDTIHSHQVPSHVSTVLTALPQPEPPKAIHADQTLSRSGQAHDTHGSHQVSTSTSTTLPSHPLSAQSNTIPVSQATSPSGQVSDAPGNKETSPSAVKQ
ncbi:MAG: deoxycytidine triphosphate deaminase [Alphaproteobacteria bacterium]